MQTWIWIVGALLLGAVLGGVAAFLVARRRWADAARAEELQRELDGYKQEVGDHFVHTAELVNNLTRSYKAVYDHLEQGAYRLVDEETLRKQLGNVDAESIKLEYIGRRDAAAVLGPGGAAGGTVAASDAADAETSADKPPRGAFEPDSPPEPEESGAWARTDGAATPATEPLDETGLPAGNERAKDSDRGSAPWNREPGPSGEDGEQPDGPGPLKEEGSVR